jgi:Flp pilus assembly protein TadG
MTRGLQHEGSLKPTRYRRGYRPGQRGSSLVEQSFIIVFLLAMILGIVDFGRALYTYHFVSNVAREATRWASVRSGRNCNGVLLGCPASNANIQTTYKANMSTMGLDPSKITFTTTYAAPPSVRSTSCPNVNNLPGCMVHVDVRYDYTFLFAPFIAAPPVTMTSSSEMLITQ